MTPRVGEVRLGFVPFSSDNQSESGKVGLSGVGLQGVGLSACSRRSQWGMQSFVGIVACCLEAYGANEMAWKAVNSIAREETHSGDRGNKISMAAKAC